jgi:hypothetical protein
MQNVVEVDGLNVDLFVHCVDRVEKEGCRNCILQGSVCHFYMMLYLLLDILPPLGRLIYEPPKSMWFLPIQTPALSRQIKGLCNQKTPSALQKSNPHLKDSSNSPKG